MGVPRRVWLSLVGVAAVVVSSGAVLAESSAAGWRVVPGPPVAAHTSTWLGDISRVPGRAMFWVVGSSSRHGRPAERVVIWQKAGGIWRSFAGPGLAGQARLNGVAAVSRADVWAVGRLDQSAIERYGGLILRWNGRYWSKVAFPTPKGTSNYLAFNAVTAPTSRDVIAVGEYLPVAGPDVRPLAERWDGHRWSVMPTTPIAGCAAGFRAVTALPTHRWQVAVGGCVSSVTTRRRPLIEAWTGRKWARVSSPRTAGTLNDVVAVSPTSIWAVGDTTPDDYHQGRPLVEHWDGRGWAMVATPRLPFGGDLRGVARIPGCRGLWAVGMRFTSGGAGRVLTERWDGRSWKIVPAPSPDDFDALNAVAAGPRHRARGVGFTARQTATSEPGLLEVYQAGGRR